eukprot:11089240-Lingulodinium_polyedra.AAC.1
MDCCMCLGLSEHADVVLKFKGALHGRQLRDALQAFIVFGSDTKERLKNDAGPQHAHNLIRLMIADMPRNLGDDITKKAIESIKEE